MRSRSTGKKAEVDSKILNIEAGVLELSKNPGFLSAQDLIIEVASLLGIQAPEQSKFSFILDQRFIKNEPWFMWHEVFPDKRAGETLKHIEGMPLEIKIYWLNKIASDRIKGIVRFTDNYEDNMRTRDDVKTQVGLDFIIHSKADGITIALSNNGIVRVLELKGKLNNTSKQILASWLEIAAGEKRLARAYLHQSLWNTFELKVVNQKFYDMISTAFTELKQHLEYNKVFSEIDAKQFANRMIGRLLFIWFLRKKDFISEEKVPYFKTEDLDDTSYYRQRLERLFFETLNKPIELRDALNDDLRTPYLNGGLFYRQENDTPKNNFSFPSNYFANLYKNLNEYNFTTDESTPDFEQVAIDPEMLGRVFENLLASMTTETGEQARKAKGAFYTPREIVQFMCRESVREYLYSSLGRQEFGADIDRLIDTPDYEWANNESNKVRDISNKGEFGKKVVESVKKLKVLDPACGSGAFPIGMLQTLLRIYTRLNRTVNEYETKLTILENNIYGVDIEPMAVEISRLRAFLALAVDQEYNENNKNGGIDTLPNLEFKFVCADSLLKLNQEGGLYDSKITRGNKKVDLQEQLTIIKKKYFKANWQEKKKLEDELDKHLKQVGLFESKKYTQLRSYHPIRQISPATFYDPELMHDVTSGFEIVIGNPPYVRVQEMSKAATELYKYIYLSTTGSFDLYMIFTERAIGLICKNGMVNFIMPHKWLNSASGKGLRSFAKDHISKIISFKEYQVFNATTYTSLLWFKKYSESVKYIGPSHDLSTNVQLAEFLNTIKEEDFIVTRNSSFSEGPWIFGNEGTTFVLNKLNQQKLRVNDVFEKIFQGIKTGNDDVYILHDCRQINSNMITGFSKAKNQNVIVETGITKPLLKGSNIHRYQLLKPNKVVIFPYQKVDTGGTKKMNLYLEPELKLSFPEGYRYLKEFEKNLRGREGGRFDQDFNWFQYSRNQGILDVDKEKIILSEVSLGSNMTIDGKGIYHVGQYSMIKFSHVKESYYYFLGILNSNLMWFFIKNTGTILRGGYFAFRPDYLRPFPLPSLQNRDLKQKIDRIVKQIMALKEFDDNSDTGVLESEIDQLVYQLYELTPEEIKIVEGAGNIA